MPFSYAAAASGSASSSRKPRRRHPRPSPSNPSAVSDSDPSSYSSSGEETDLTASDPAAASVISSYLSVAGDGADLSKVGIFLSSAARRRSPPCLICFDPIRPSDPVWSCSASCFALLHLHCIQSWAHQSSSAAPSPTWGCPKCRFPYPKSQTPTSYLCFCSKTVDPAPDPWILPHSCGDVCGRRLNADRDSGCEHNCLLLCHPGPCPPCPAIVPNAMCFCGSHRETRRCSHQRYSCSGKCNKRLGCGIHRCPVDCHDGPCPPCAVRGKHKCECGETMEERLCSERVFQCKRECGGMLQCGKHSCERGCHAGKCGGCPLQGRRTCPCGKKDYPSLDCDAEAATCGSTCEKVLGCGRHKCPERCHRGSCVETCRLVITKSCRCGGLKKEVPCYQELTCERKCQRLRNCGRHACRRRCCEGDCAPCPEVCDKRLRCGNHKCLSPCHRCHGPIAPPNPEFTLKPIKRKKGKPLDSYTWNTMPAMPRSCFGAMLWTSSWPRTCKNYRIVPICAQKYVTLVNVRCACNNLKKEWICQDVLKEYRQSGRDPKQIPKNQYAVGLLACGEDCVKKVKAADSELHLRKIQEIKTPAVEVENVPKRRKRRNRGQESVESSKFQEIKAVALKFLLVIFLCIIVVAGLYLLWKGVYRLSDWMNDMEEQRARQRHLKPGRL
ncbi:hypothetical protein OsJ_00458 [Oryza sativa Japonica Group]|uniref:RING-type domain-containing protein n=1 Tax=Oryza sativa subsp. japonica TaxID=39947 RepID=B9ESZ2_ORYSJ|nr:hypothetical protein OsJ_00458 [Oryza sativa Japonica Group]